MSRQSQRSIVAAALLFGVSSVYAGDVSLPRSFAGRQPLEWSVRMADSEIPRLGRARWDYTVGLFMLSLLKLNEHVANPAYVECVKTTVGSLINPDGQIQGYKLEDYNLDNINEGKTALALYQLTKDEKYRKAAALLRKQFDVQPRTSEGGFWHKQR